MGKRRMQLLIDTLRSECAPLPIRIILQTNGTLLDEEWLHLFERNQVTFGLSLDGPPAIADRRCVDHHSKGSTVAILENIAVMRALGSLFDELCTGCLCVIDPEADGKAMVDWFVDAGFKAFDFLLPDGNRANPPQDWTGVGPYKRFMLEAFERWYALGNAAPRIRKFELMMTGLMGVKPALDALGGDLSTLCVIESDGSIGVNDVARICGGDYSVDLLNVFEHPIDAHGARYKIREVQELCDQCKTCPALKACGGGYLPHRFDGKSFENPSLYCDVLYSLAERMTEVMILDLPPAAICWANDTAEGHTVGPNQLQ